MVNDYSKLSKEELLKVVEKLESRKKYGLIWDEERTKEQFEKESENALPVLKEVKGKEIKTDPANPVNILIEGDNYHALSVLNYTHNGKVDVVYIDPPYNRGGSDFKYNDCYVDKDDSYRHSKWLAFMNKRLRLLKPLLKESSVVFISIDDSELFQLKLLCDAIFGENNFVGNVIVRTNPRGRTLDRHLAKTFEYILIYSKNIELANVLQIAKGEKALEEYKKEDKNGKYRELELRNRNPVFTRKNRPNLYYPIYINPATMQVSLEKDKKYYETALPLNSQNEEGCWTWSKKKVNKNLDLLVAKKVSTGAWRVYRKDYIPEDGATTKVKALWLEKNMNHENGKEELGRIFGTTPFDFPKSVELIKRCLEISTSDQEPSIILDFFAGSGTTAQAVLESNQKDNGSRQFILCTNDEGGIASNVCYPRLERVIKGYKFSGKEKEVLYENNLTFSKLKKFDQIIDEIDDIKENNEFDSYEEKLEENNILKLYGTKNIDGNKAGLGGNLKYFKTSFVKRTIGKDSLKIRITHECTEMLCLREGIFNEVKKTDDYRIFKHNDHVMGVYYSLERDELKSLKKEFDKIKGKKILYCFTLDPLGLDKKDFGDWEGVSLEPIPQKILDIYEGIYEY